MNCADFQKALPYIIESGGNADEEAHLHSCPVCTDLVADLKYIANQAKLLVPMEDPSSRVWSGIEQSLKREGLVARTPVASMPNTPNTKIRVVPPWMMGARLGAVAALAILAVALLVRPFSKIIPEQGPTSALSNPLPDQDDQRFLAEVETREPGLRSAYEDNLRDVNAYIADAGQRMARYPDDEVAREHLVQAYDQKAALFEMADSHPSQ